MIEISSFSNPRYKHVKSLAKSRNRKKEGLFLMEGREELDMAYAKGVMPVSVLFSEAYVSAEEIAARYGQKMDMIRLSKPLFDELAYQNVPNNYLGIFKSWEKSLNEIEPEQTTVILEGIEKPGNLGAILRTCEAAGVRNVLVTNSQIDLFNPNVIRNSRGAFLNVNAVFCSNEEALQWCESKELDVYATALSGEAIEFRKVIRTKKHALVFGSEANGITEFWKSNAQIITIPMQGSVDSLNLSVSVGIVLFN